jgi:type IX secretion system PorP/SprF family membrane protein
MFNHLTINPAYAGSREALNLTLVARRQWVAIDGAPTTNVFSIQAPSRKKKVGVGLEFANEKIGPKQIAGTRLSYSYRLPLLTGKLAFGLRAGFFSYQMNWHSAIKYKDQADYYAQLPDQSKGVFTADFGMYYYTKSFYWGVCATNLTQSTYFASADSIGSEASLKPHIFSPIGMGFSVSDKLVINPSVLVKYVSGAPVGIDVNCNFLIDEKLWLGVSGRKGYGVAVLMMWNVTEKFRFGYSYDHGMNKIGILGKSSHEVVLGYDFNIYKTKTITPRYL